VDLPGVNLPGVNLPGVNLPGVNLGWRTVAPPPWMLASVFHICFHHVSAKTGAG